MQIVCYKCYAYMHMILFSILHHKSHKTYCITAYVDILLHTAYDAYTYLSTPLNSWPGHLGWTCFIVTASVVAWSIKNLGIRSYDGSKILLFISFMILYLKEIWF